MPGSINSHYFHTIGDGHQPNSRGLYTHYKDSYQRWDDHPQKNATFDHGTYLGNILYFVVIFFLEGGSNMFTFRNEVVIS